MIEFIAGLIFGSFLASAAFVSRLVYVVNSERWRKSVEPGESPERFRQRTVANRERSTTAAQPEPQPRPHVQGTARVRPIRRVR